MKGVYQEPFSLYTDASVVYDAYGEQPVGIVWGWIRVEEDTSHILLASGVDWSETVSNSGYGEFLSALLAVEELPKHWSGTMYSDYLQTIEWFFQKRNFPDRLWEYHDRYEQAKYKIQHQHITGMAIPAHQPWKITKHPLNNYIDVVCRKVGKVVKNRIGQPFDFMMTLDTFSALSRTPTQGPTFREVTEYLNEYSFGT